MSKRNKSRVQIITEIIKNHPIQTIGWSMFSFFAMGVLNAMFSRVFEATSTALSNTSKGVLIKIVDFFYIYAASANETDVFMLPLFVIMAVAIVLPMTLVSVIKLLGERTVRTYDEVEEVEKELESFGLLKESKKVSSAQRIEDLKKKSKKLKKQVKESIDSQHKTLIRLRVGLFFYIVCMSIQFFLNLSSVTILQMFNLDLLRVRPNVADSEIYDLKKRWVCMSSRRDYLEIERLISEYGKRSGFNLENSDNIKTQQRVDNE